MSLHHIVEKILVHKNEKAYLNWFNYVSLGKCFRFLVLAPYGLRYETFNPNKPDFTEVDISIKTYDKVKIFEEYNATDI